MNAIKIKLFGHPDVEVNGVRVDFYRRKCLALLAYLAVTGERHSRESLANLLWPEASSTRALANLRNVLYTLNQLRGMDILNMDRKTVTLSGQSEIWVDVNEFRRTLKLFSQYTDKPVSSSSPVTETLKQAMELSRDDFMIGFSVRDSIEFEQWQLMESQTLSRERQIAMQKLVHLLETSQDWDLALVYARQLIDADPLEESAHRRVMTLLAKSGRSIEALKQYQICCSILSSELDIGPDMETQELYTSILNGKILPVVPDRIQISASYPLPSQTIPLCGRKTEMHYLSQAITQTAHRLMSITGPGGCGKTRLAQQLAHNCAAFFSDGIAWVPLASVSAPEFIASTLARSLNMNFPRMMLSPKSPDDLRLLMTQLLIHLQDKQMLIILDNFDHLIDGAGIVSEILDAAPQIQILITSRERLNLHGEWVYELTGLEFPGPDEQRVHPVTDAERFFIQTAQQTAMSFSVTEMNRSDIGRICRLVQGLPLALELSAAWVRVLNCQEIAAQIQTNLDFLASSQKNMPARHRSIRAVFEQSWERLPQDSRDCFKRLSVFRGGFSRRAAFEAAGADYRGLASLIDKSLLQRTTSDRFELHEVLRQYAEERLKREPQEAVQVRHRHARYYLQLVREKEKTIRGFDQEGAVRFLQRDIGNIRMAWLWAAENGDFEGLLNAAPGLFLFFDIQNQFLDGYDLFSQATELLQPYLLKDSHGTKKETRDVLMGYILGIQAWFLRYVRLSVNATKDTAQTVDSSRSSELMAAALSAIHPYRHRAEWAQIELLSIYLKTPKFKPQTAEEMKRCLDVFQIHKDSWGTAMCLDGIGSSLKDESIDEQEKYVRQGLKVREDAGDQWGMGISYIILGMIESKRENFQQAKRYYQQSYLIRHEQGLDINGEIDILAFLADMEFKLSQFDLAFQHFKTALTLSQTMSNFRRTSIILGLIGKCYYETGDMTHAEDYLKQCMALSARHGCGDACERYLKILDQIDHFEPCA